MVVDNVGGTGHILGDVGIGPNGSLVLGGGSDITGTAFRDSTGSISLGTGTIDGGVVVQSMSGAMNDAFGAAAAFTAHAADQTISGNLTTSTSFTPIAGGTKFIDINGDVNLGGSSILSFSGAANDYYVVNVTGQFMLGGTAKIQLSGGMTAQNLIFNIEYNNATNNGVNLASGTHAFGTFLVPFSEVKADGGSQALPVLTGAFIGDGESISLMSTPWVVGQPIPPVPEPGTLALVGCGAAALVSYRWRRRRWGRIAGGGCVVVAAALPLRH
jgi:hypothetical protein